MKKISLLLLLPLLCNCGVTLEKSKYIEGDKYYRIGYNINNIDCFNNSYFYFKDKKIYLTDGAFKDKELFEYRFDDNNFIYNYSTHKIWGKLYENGFVVTYNHTYEAKFEVLSIYGNASYLKMLGVNL